MSIPRDRVRRAFVLAAGCAMALFIMVSLWSVIEGRGPSSRARSLMPVIRAQMVDEPLTALQADFSLEATPRPGRPSALQLGSLAPGRLLFVNFWATWCEPCVREIPSMIRLSRQITDPRFAMIAVSYDQAWEPVTGFFRKVLGGLPREITLARDPSAADESMLRTSFGTHKLPETYVIVDGHVVSRFVNERDWMEPAMVEYFERLLESL